MLGFLLKKNFFDLWDNMLKIALINLGFIISAAITIFLPYAVINSPVWGGIVFFICILWCVLYTTAAAGTLKALSDYGTFSIADFISNLKTAWPQALVLAGLLFIILILMAVVTPFYLGMRSVTGLLLGVFIFWILVMAILSLQFFLAGKDRLDTRYSKIIKKCFIVFFDNPGFCIFVMIHNLFILIICLFPLFFLFPGPAGVLLFLDQGLRLRLLKYDWLQANAKTDTSSKKNIPWEEILEEEKEKTGNRSFRGLIFPWKE